MKTVITQEKLINEIALSEDINVATVQVILKSAERIIANYLSSTTPIDSYVIKPLAGFNIESKHIPPRNINRGLFQNYQCNDKIKVNSTVTRYYQDKINDLHTQN